MSCRSPISPLPPLLIWGLNFKIVLTDKSLEVLREKEIHKMISLIMTSSKSMKMKKKFKKHIHRLSKREN